MNYSLKDIPITLAGYVLGVYCLGLLYQPEYLWQESPVLAFATIVLAVPLLQNYAGEIIKSYLKKSAFVLCLSANLGFVGGVIYDRMPVEKSCAIGERC